MGSRSQKSKPSPHEYSLMELSQNCNQGVFNLGQRLASPYDSSLLFLMETRATRDKAQRQAKHTGFSGNFIVDSKGQSGGLWCLWDVASWKVEVLESSYQFIHARMT